VNGVSLGRDYHLAIEDVIVGLKHEMTRFPKVKLTLSRLRTYIYDFVSWTVHSLIMRKITNKMH
jgi:hypothetical protein